MSRLFRIEYTAGNSVDSFSAGSGPSFAHLVEIHDNNVNKSSGIPARANMLSKDNDLHSRADALGKGINSLTREAAACQLARRGDEFVDLKARYILAQQFNNREALAALAPKMAEFAQLEKQAFALPSEPESISDEEATSRARAILSEHMRLPHPGSSMAPEKGVVLESAPISKGKAEADALAILKDFGLI